MGVRKLFRDKETVAGDGAFWTKEGFCKDSGDTKSGVGSHCDWDLVGF